VTFDGSTARTISYNSVGAPSAGGAGASGTWGINISGNAATASSATSAGSATTAASAGQVANAVTFNNGGSGGASGSSFNGSGALTISYNSVGAPSAGGAGASGTWNIAITGNAATATSATTASTANALNSGNSYTAVGFTATSDRARKKRIKLLGGRADRLAMVHGYAFAWRHNGKADHGVMWDEVRAAFPALAVIHADGTRAVNYNGLVAVLIEKVNALGAELETLKRGRR
jgi:hypothetical protein